MSQYASSPFPPCWSPLSRTRSSLAGLCLFRMGKGYFLPPSAGPTRPLVQVCYGFLDSIRATDVAHFFFFFFMSPIHKEMYMPYIHTYNRRTSSLEAKKNRLPYWLEGLRI